MKFEGDSDKHSREAIHWLMALQEEPDDPALRARFDAWKNESPENERAWAETSNVWSVLGEVPAHRAATSQLNENSLASSRENTASVGVDPEAHTPPVWHINRQKMTGASVLVAAFCLLFFLSPAINIWFSADYSTDVAGQQMVELEDGTIVYLGANSAIDVAYERNIRHVNLLSGEAFFEVKPNPKRPFVVGVGEFETRVLGTAFNVRLMSEGAMVAVAHGSVAVSYPKAQQEIGPPLTAGNWTRVSWNGAVERGAVDPEQVAAWRTGNLIVSDETVGDVVDELRRYYSGIIIMVGSKLSDEHITGVYKLKKPVSALQAVAEAHGATVRKITSGILVVSRF